MAVATDIRLNLGCGEYLLQGFINIDSMICAPGVIVAEVPPLAFSDESVSEVYMGHFLEHMDGQRGRELLRECFRVLVPGGKIGVVVPDFRECARRYVMNEEMMFQWPAGSWHDMRDLDKLCHFILFSTCQPSHHLWAYDLDSLGRALAESGFEVTAEINRYEDARQSTPQWYQCGLDAVKPA